MSKVTSSLLLFMVLILFYGCHNKSGKVNKKEWKESEQHTVVQEDTVRCYFGVCGEGTSMNVLELITMEGDTMELPMMEAHEKNTLFGGLENGDHLAVEVGCLKSSMPCARQIINLTALKGTWVVQKANADNQIEGIDIEEKGKILSINMPTQDYKKWFISGGKLWLTSIVDTDGKSEKRTDAFDFLKLDEDSLIIKGENGILAYRKQK